MTKHWIHAWIKTPCGRAKYAELEAQRGLSSRIRLGWFILFATLRDWNLTQPDQSEDSNS